MVQDLCFAACGWREACCGVRQVGRSTFATFTQDPSRNDQFTLHSLKCALLSAAAQLRLPDESRRLQGHHRLLSDHRSLVGAV